MNVKRLVFWCRVFYLLWRMRGKRYASGGYVGTGDPDFRACYGCDLHRHK